MIDGATRTSGQFATEEVAWQWFDEMMAACGEFRVLREVEGEYMHPRPLTEMKAARIDRLLIPLRPAIEAGWVDGAIGIEGKKSDHKIGKVFTQALDYTRCVFKLEQPPGLLIVPTWIFVFPAEAPIGDMESITLNNRIGTANEQSGRLVFKCGALNVIIIERGQSVIVKRPTMGYKRGSR